MKQVNFGRPISNDPAAFQQWVIQMAAAIEQSSQEDPDTTVNDAYVVTGDPQVRELDATGTATAVTDGSGGTVDPTNALAAPALAAVPVLAWNGATYPTLAEATAMIAALTALNAAITQLTNNLSTLTAAHATALTDSGSVRDVLATLIQDGRYRGTQRDA